MTRTLAGHIALLLFRHASLERYPTRTVEHMLAWMMIVWSAGVARPGNLMDGPLYQYLLVLAPEPVWGWFGISIGVLRLLALYINGNWRRTPGFRFLGAMFGLIWWLVLASLYWLAVQNGARDFPMRNVFFVFMFFEAYSCYRCGQDHASPKCGDAGHGK